ncbi:MAG TPA: TIM barrel protein [Limnochordia bacterium]
MPTISTAPSESVASLSTGSLARVVKAADPRALAALVAKLAPPGIELLVYSAWSEALPAAVRAFEPLDVPIRTVHGEKRIGGGFGSPDPALRRAGIDQFKRSADLAAAVGSRYLSIHLWDLPDSDDDLERNLDAYAEVQPFARARGLTVLFEVIPCRKRAPLDNMRHVVRALGPEALFTLDYEFLSWHGPIETQLPAIVAEFGQRIVNLHVRDYDGAPFDADRRRRYVRPGAGRIPFGAVEAALAAAPRARIFTLEAAYSGDGWEAELGCDLRFVGEHARRASGERRQDTA